ncbi:hypothetical protein BR93DRAFT_926756 [Coniochaeta sp. PMI_546]|nr:hypothetical protein BR93DRAFT_926756 [Coniochaeta sp. PMI_546]
MDTTISDQANNGEAFCPLSGRKAAPTPGMTEAARQAHTIINGQEDNGQASVPSKKWKALQFPPGMTRETRQAHMEQYLKDRAVARLTAENTRYNQEDKKLVDFVAKNTKSKKKVKWSDLPQPSQP